ncbi:CLUMA_CG009294, isoform A [Clunio marinus]|uniref:CLUMA_CG009294, isoform A n=1 Tax=Clunio marinus TaxID=568069 RepID=A0A1J1IA60_9DIPT|nr:CLUMA_CG009294, isoform A [Clunio marinus]
MTNVTLTAEGKMIKAHKLILAASSKYFESLFTSLEEEKHLVIALKDIPMKHLIHVLEYIYCGQVDLNSQDVAGFKEVAESLQIKVDVGILEASKSIVDQEMRALSQTTLAGVSSSRDLMMDHSMNSLNTTNTLTDTSLESIDEQLDDTRDEPEPAARKRKHNENNLMDDKKRSSLDPYTKTARRILRYSHIDRTKKPIESTMHCGYCRRSHRISSINYHQKHCWSNPKRTTSECKHCRRKLETPAKLRHHAVKCGRKESLMWVEIDVLFLTKVWGFPTFKNDSNEELLNYSDSQESNILTRLTLASSQVTRESQVIKVSQVKSASDASSQVKLKLCTE